MAQKIYLGVQRAQEIAARLQTSIDVISDSSTKAVKAAKALKNECDSNAMLLVPSLSTCAKSYEATMRKMANTLKIAIEMYSGIDHDISKKAEDIDSNMLADLKIVNNEKVAGILPDWAKKTDKRGDNYYCAENKKNGKVSQRNNDGYLSCTYYTLRRLRERGLGYPFKYAGNTNGGNWYKNCSDQAVKAEGKGCLNELFNNYGDNGKDVRNVVISFKGGSYGHVVLIDRLYKDPNTGEIKVEWSDMLKKKGSDAFGKISDANGSNAPISMTIDDFFKYYKDMNYSANGAVLIGE